MTVELMMMMIMTTPLVRHPKNMHSTLAPYDGELLISTSDLEQTLPKVMKSTAFNTHPMHCAP